MSHRRFQGRPQLETLEDRLCPSASTVVLPISAFTSQQGHDMVFTPPVPDEQAWSDSIFDPGAAPDPNRLLQADFAGTSAQYLLTKGINLHTTITGFVTETPITGSNLMEVSVNLEATNALTWVVDVAGLNPNSNDVNKAPLELGYRAQDLVANPNLKPALSNVHFQLTFQEQTGANLPDLPRLNENFALYAPPELAFERFDFQSWGTGTLNTGTTVGTPGQTAVVSTWQIADLTNPALTGTYGDGFFQEPIDIIPVASASSHLAYLNGTLFITDLSNGNDNVQVTPAANGGATVSSNLGSGTFAAITKVVVALGGGNNKVQIGNLTGTTVDVVAFDGNNNITVGNVGKLVVSVGGGNNNITTGNTSLAAQFLFVGGNGNNNIAAANTNSAEIVVAGNGNNHINATGAGDFIEVLGNGNNNLTDTGTNDLFWVGGDGNNNIANAGLGSFTDILAGTGHNHIVGWWGLGDGGGAS